MVRSGSSARARGEAAIGIETVDLVKDFGTLRAVDHVSISVARGSFFGLLGPNGAGKTTLLRMLTTIMRPTQGSARVGGYDIQSQALAVRRAIGVVAQADYLDGYLTARQNLVVHAWMHHLPRAVYEPRIDEVLRLTELLARQHERPKTFSGGMQRRLVLARALVHNPTVLFLDEPTSGLDPQARRAIWDYLDTLRGRVTVFLTTHYMEEADQLCDRVAILDQGRILVEGTPAKLKRESLTGQRYELQLKGNQQGFREAVDHLVCSWVEQDERILVELRPDVSVKTLLEPLPAEAILQVSRREPTLEDVFIELTGRRLRD